MGIILSASHLGPLISSRISLAFFSSHHKLFPQFETKPNPPQPSFA